LELVKTDRLAWAFIVDAVCLSVFQSWLVEDDVLRRSERGATSKSALLAARFIPYFGLAYYLTSRPTLIDDKVDQ